MSEREKILLNECCKYAICAIRNQYYRLGGHGCVPLRWNEATLRNLEKAGLVAYTGYWRATQKGRDLVEHRLPKEPQEQPVVKPPEKAKL